MNRAEEQRADLTVLLARVGDGDGPALAQVYQKTSVKLTGIAFRLLGDQGEAEDVVQETYLAVWRSAAGFDPRRASPMTWLMVLARNRAISKLRSRRDRYHAPLDEAVDVADDAPDVLTAVHANETARRLAECLDRLDTSQAEAIRGAFFGGLTYSELARARGLPLSTAKSWIRRGLQRLRGCLEQ